MPTRRTIERGLDGVSGGKQGSVRAERHVRACLPATLYHQAESSSISFKMPGLGMGDRSP